MKKKRPKEITIIASIFLVSAIVLTIITICSFLYSLGYYIASLGPTSDPCVPDTQTILKIALPVLSILSLITIALWIIGSGLLKLKEFARKLTIIFACGCGIILIALLCCLIGTGEWYMLFDPRIFLILSLILFSLFSAYYFTRSKIKEQFKSKIDVA